jgi:hypothetical protein
MVLDGMADNSNGESGTMTLEPCNRRGPEMGTGHFECLSNRLMHPEAGIASAHVCQICIYRDKPDRDDLPKVERKSRGLGDTIAKFTHATGITQAVEAVSNVTGVPCGCKERQEWLNRVVPYRQEQDR